MIDDHDLYNDDYFDMYYKKDNKRLLMYLQEKERITERVRQGNILDVGCGVGGFLELFDDRWTKYGYEPSEFASEKAVRKGIHMYRAMRTVESDSMDVVVFRGTLQHINTPIEHLAHATRALRKGGLLVILATPDTDSLVYKIFGNLPALDAPKNWIVFGGRILENILERLGYVNITITHPYLYTPYAQPLSDFTKFFISLFFGYRKFAFPGNQMEIFSVKK